MSFAPGCWITVPRIRARWWFGQWYQWYWVSYFMHSNLTCITGYFEQTISRLILAVWVSNDKFSHGKNLLTAKTNMYTWLVKQRLTCCNQIWVYELTPINPLLTIHRLQWQAFSPMVNGQIDWSSPTKKSGPPQKVDCLFLTFMVGLNQ